VNPDYWRRTCGLCLSMQPDNSLHTPGAHSWDFENCLWWVMEIVERERDEERWWSRANHIKNWYGDVHGVRCRVKALECDRPTRFKTHITCLVVDQTLWGWEGFECKFSYIETIYWLPITTVCIVTYNCWAFNDSWDVIKVSVNAASMIFGLTFLATKGISSHIHPKWLYLPVL